MNSAICQKSMKKNDLSLVFDLDDPTEMLWQNIKQAIYTKKPSNLVELKQFCKEQWFSFSPKKISHLVWLKKHWIMLFIIQ